MPPAADACPALDLSPDELRRRLTCPDRLAALDATGLAAAGADAVLDRLARTASALLGVPVSLVSLVDGEAQHFAGAAGRLERAGDVRGTPLDTSLCQYVAATAEPLVVADAGAHPVLREHGAYTRLGVVAYAGVPLTTSGGETLGSFCAIDTAPRAWTEAQLAGLRDLASAAMAEIELRLAHHRLGEREAALAEREARLGLIYHGVTDLLFLMRVERDGAGAVAAYRCESVNRRYLEATGLREAELVGRTLREILPPAAAAHAEARYREAIATGATLRYDEEADFPAGRLVVETTLAPVRDAQGRCTHLLGAARDVGALRRAERGLRESEARFRAVLENLRAPAVKLDVAGRVTFANDAALALTGWPRELLVGHSWFERCDPDAAASGAAYARAMARGAVRAHVEGVVRRRDGSERQVVWDNVVLRDEGGRVVGAAGVGQDVTDQRALQARLAALSERDELTGLLNRRGFRRMADHAMQSGARTGRRDALLYLDLDHFKPINDAFGHAAGDAALQAVARVLRDAVRAGDVVGRLGGDEFVVYAVGLAHEGEGHVLASRLRAAAAAQNDAAAAARLWRLAFSVGVADREPGDTLDDLLARADGALYAAKLARAG